MDFKLRESERVIESQKKADYTFIQQNENGKVEDNLEDKMQRRMQEIQVKRLDRVDHLLADPSQSTQSTTSFLGMSSLSYYFDHFASEMLSKASKATNLLDLQEEMNLNYG